MEPSYTIADTTLCCKYCDKPFKTVRGLLDHNKNGCESTSSDNTGRRKRAPFKLDTIRHGCDSTSTDNTGAGKRPGFISAMSDEERLHRKKICDSWLQLDAAKQELNKSLKSQQTQQPWLEDLRLVKYCKKVKKEAEFGMTIESTKGKTTFVCNFCKQRFYSSKVSELLDHGRNCTIRNSSSGDAGMQRVGSFPGPDAAKKRKIDEGDEASGSFASLLQHPSTSSKASLKFRKPQKVPSSEQKYSCKYCEMETGKYEEFWLHVKTAHPKTIKQYPITPTIPIVKKPWIEPQLTPQIVYDKGKIVSVIYNPVIGPMAESRSPAGPMAESRSFAGPMAESRSPAGRSYLDQKPGQVKAGEMRQDTIPCETRSLAESRSIGHDYKGQPLPDVKLEPVDCEFPYNEITDGSSSVNQAYESEPVTQVDLETAENNFTPNILRSLLEIRPASSQGYEGLTQIKQEPTECEFLSSETQPLAERRSSCDISDYMGQSLAQVKLETSEVSGELNSFSRSSALFNVNNLTDITDVCVKTEDDSDQEYSNIEIDYDGNVSLPDLDGRTRLNAEESEEAQGGVPKLTVAELNYSPLVKVEAISDENQSEETAEHFVEQTSEHFNEETAEHDAVDTHNEHSSVPEISDIVSLTENSANQTSASGVLEQAGTETRETLGSQGFLPTPIIIAPPDDGE